MVAPPLWDNPQTAALSPGGGGGGAYTSDVVSVTPGLTYSIVVGAGGTAGSAGNSGANGGDSQFSDGNNILDYARGGQGGSVTVGAPAASGGQADPNAMISHPGFSAQFNSSTAPNAINGGPPWAMGLLPSEFLPAPFPTSVPPPPNPDLGVGGTSGIGDAAHQSCWPTNGANVGAENGGSGYVLLRW